MKFVLIGKLYLGDFFGEIIVLKGFLMLCLVIIEIYVEMGIIFILDVIGKFLVFLDFDDVSIKVFDEEFYFR